MYTGVGKQHWAIVLLLAHSLGSCAGGYSRSLCFSRSAAQCAQRRSPTNSGWNAFSASKLRPLRFVQLQSTNHGRLWDLSSQLRTLFSLDTEGDLSAMQNTSLRTQNFAETSEFLRSKAERLSRQAERLKLEAEKEELQLELIRLEKRQKRMEKTEDLILQILNSSLAELKNVVIENRQYIDAELLFRLGELANVAKTAAERERYIGASDYLLLTLEGVDSKASEAISKVIVNEVNDSRMQPSDISTTNREPLSYTDPTLSGDMLRKWIERTLQSSSINTTNIETFPQFIPPSLVPFVLRSYESPLKQDDLETLRKEVFTMDTFYVTAVESTPVLSLFRGNLRSDSAEVFKRVQQKLSAVPGLADRVQVFLMPDPTPEAVRRMEMMKDGMNGPLPDPDPVFVVISKAAEPFAQGWPILLLTVLCGLGSVFTTFSYAIGTYAFNSEFLSKLSEGDTSVVAKTLPVLFALLGVQLLHELGHTVAAKFHGIKLSPPILIPSLQLGSFGAITRILSFPKDRIALFDVAVAGPMLGMIASFALLAFGLWTTGHTASPEDLANFPVIPAAIFRSSLLVGLVTEFLQPNAISSLATVPVAVSPLTLAAISGLLVNALNLMPVGRLDGGRMSTATLGRRAAGNVGNLVLLVQALSFLFSTSTLQLFWGLLIVLVQRPQDLPAQDEVTLLDGTRTKLFYAAMVLTALTLLPFPGGGSFF